MVDSPIDTLIIGIYFLGMIGIGFWGYRSSTNLDDYLVAGRNVPFWMYVPVASAIIIGGASTLGSAGFGYQYGISGAWLVISLGIGIAVLGILISTRLANLKAYTLGNVLEKRYDEYSGTIGAVIAGAYALALAITEVIAVGKVLSVVTGYGDSLMIIIGGLVIIIYSVLGGMLSITITDFIQWCIMTIGIFLLAIPFGLDAIGGISALTAELEPQYFSPINIGVFTIIGFITSYTLGIMIGQDIWQRVFTAKDGETARKGNITVGIYSILYGIGATLLGMIAVVYLGDIADPESALPILINRTVPAGLSGIIFAGFISAMMSTASAGLLASSTLITEDVYSRFINPNATERRSTFVTRSLIVIFGLIMIYAAAQIGNVVNALTLAYNLLTGSLFVPIFGAFFWNRSTWQGALSAIGVSIIVVVVSLWIYGFDSSLPIFLGMATSFVLFVGVSLLSDPPTQEKLQQWLQETESSPSVE
jgi:SSS family solute:Na+ symporter